MKRSFRTLCCACWVISFLLFHSCERPKELVQLSAEDKQWMEKFFHDLLFVEGAVYTLWGSKPITEVILYHYTDEEMHEILGTLSKQELENCYVNETYDLPENWEKWEKMQADIPIKKYLLFRSRFDEDGKASFVYFVDIQKATSVIKCHYELFRQAIGYDFDPDQVVMDMQNRDSMFWNKLQHSKESPLLWGLLFGYGELNSKSFYSKYFQSDISSEPTKNHVYQFSNPSPEGQVRISKNNFNIPQFVSFDQDDEMANNYMKERDKIKKIYQSNDLVHITLKKLSS